MAPDLGFAAETGPADFSFTDEAGRPIGEYEPPALVRLAHLQGEAVETARIANLLGRTPPAAGALFASCALIAAASAGAVPAIMLGLWTLFVTAAALAMLRAARQVSRSAFELLPLRAFALDLNAVMLYAGFAWGAGAFLALPPGAQGWMLAAFAIGGAAAIGMLLRARNATLYFLAPNVVLAAGSALLGPAGWDAAAGLLALGLALAGAAELLERLAARRIQAPGLASLTLS